MTEGSLLAHMTQMYVRVSCSALVLISSCHQCAIRTLATKSEIDLLDTVYIASPRMHTTEAQIDSYFYLCSKVYLVAVILYFFSVYWFTGNDPANKETPTST